MATRSWSALKAGPWWRGWTTGAALIEQALEEAGYSQTGRARSVCGRGRAGWAAAAAALRHLSGGRGHGGGAAPGAAGEHASNLGALLALRFAQAAGVNAYIVDPVTVDEWQPCARLSGLAAGGAHRIGHALNTKAVASGLRRAGPAVRGAAADCGAHGQRHYGFGAPGRADDRQQHHRRRAVWAGSLRWLPVRALIKLCFSGTYNESSWTAMSLARAGCLLTWERAICARWSGAWTQAMRRPRWSLRPWSTRLPRRPGRWRRC